MAVKIFIFLWLCSLIKPSYELECHEKCKQYNSNGPTIIVKDTNGRLGNALFSYQVLLTLQVGFGYEAYMGQRINQTISTYFDRLRIPVGSNSICEFEALEKWLKDHVYETKAHKIERLITRRSGQKPKRGPDGKIIITREDLIKYDIDIDGLIHSNEFNEIGDIHLPDTSFPWQAWSNLSLSDLKEDANRIGQALILYPQGFSISYDDHKFLTSIPNIDEELEKDLKLKDIFLNSAQRTIARVTKEFLSSKKKRKFYDPKDLIFVGIHSRRTDHLALERVNGYKEIKPSYFIEAMHLFKQKFGDKVVFLYISDDLKWGIQNLGPRTKKSKNVFFVGEGKGSMKDSIGHDLAIMKSCNHSILSHGTFSYWAGFLSNGIVVLPDHILGSSQNSNLGRLIEEDPISNPLPRLYQYI